MTMMEPNFKRKGRRALAYMSKAWGWLSSRRTARAIAANRTAVIALTTSVAATGVGVQATVRAKDAQHSVASLAGKVAELSTAADVAKAQTAGLRDAVARLDTKDAKQLADLSKRLIATADQLHALARDVAALPPSPDLAPLADRVSKLAATASEAAQKAELATVAASEQHDPTARAAALDAFNSASAARAVAEDARKRATTAKASADALVARAAQNDETLALLRRDLDFAINTVIAANGSAVDADVTAHLADAKAAEAIARAKYNEFVRLNCSEPDLCPTYDQEYNP